MIRGQLAGVGLGFLLSCRFRELSSGCQTWWQTPLGAWPSCWANNILLASFCAQCENKTDIQRISSLLHLVILHFILNLNAIDIIFLIKIISSVSNMHDSKSCLHSVQQSLSFAHYHKVCRSLFINTEHTSVRTGHRG